MKRARIKAMVSVPARRKAAQDSSLVETPARSEDSDKSKTPSEACVSPQKSVEHDLSEKDTQDNVKITQTQNEQLNVSNSNTQCNEKAKRDSDEAEHGIVQPLEITSAIQMPSPTKVTQNRSCFMRPIPRLDSGGRVRRNSVQGSGASASESEDESRRITSVATNRIRNDSVCSVQSAKETPVNNTQSNVTKSKIGAKKRMLVSESARKLAEARREFLLKHENKTPDRSKLTMYDLIYYNPVSNPMKRSKGSDLLTRKISVCQPEEIQEEENEDDPSSSMPVPQVKVGPDGQLIIDEQSLVIEQTNAKKNREVLAKEAIIENDNTGHGFYKRRQKSKEWPKWETLKFYKALNTVGTDFLLMQSLFPHRTRQEIKLKFKKEERINRNLVEKALAYHQEFDTEMLEKSLAIFDDSEREHYSVREKKQETKRKRKIKSDRKRKSRIVASSIEEMDASDDDDDEDNNFESPLAEKNDMEDNNNQSQPARKKRTRQGCKRPREETDGTENPSIETDDVESLSSCNVSDSDTEIYNVRPTRSGRLPKVKKLQGPDINTLDNGTSDYCANDCESVKSHEESERPTDDLNLFDGIDMNSEAHYTDTIKTVIPDISQVEPGSLVILSKESPEEPGKSVLQVYMVSSNISSAHDKQKTNITPVDLPPELLATVTTRLSDVEPITIKEECE